MLKGYGCPGQSVMGAAMANVEMARVDGSMSTFLMVHNSLCMLTIGWAPAGGSRLLAVLTRVVMQMGEACEKVTSGLLAVLMHANLQRREAVEE